MWDGLEKITARADAGDIRNQSLLRMLVPDLPKDPNAGYWIFPPYFMDGPKLEMKPGKPFRAEWFREHRPQFVDDELAGGFRLKMP